MYIGQIKVMYQSPCQVHFLLETKSRAVLGVELGKPAPVGQDGLVLLDKHGFGRVGLVTPNQGVTLNLRTERRRVDHD